MFTMGIDIGSASSKVVILENGSKIIAAEVVQIGTGSTGPKRALNQALTSAGLKIEDIEKVVATGYGRFNVEEAQKQISEISCHAKGIFFLVHTARTIIDIGGQVAKAIRLDSKCNVKQFFM
ncbi:MAG: BadF/BadG/BcrA/BcrD ATPase family protein, partial [Clostridium sp.]|nr:BadF/BadG/BcrA/BcrD ATPase family protein [Clostridium sp.]